MYQSDTNKLLHKILGELQEISNKLSNQNANIESLISLQTEQEDAKNDV